MRGSRKTSCDGPAKNNNKNLTKLGALDEAEIATMMTATTMTTKTWRTRNFLKFCKNFQCCCLFQAWRIFKNFHQFLCLKLYKVFADPLTLNLNKCYSENNNQTASPCAANNFIFCALLILGNGRATSWTRGTPLTSSQSSEASLTHSWSSLQ